MADAKRKLMASVYARGGVLYVQFYKDGKLKQKSTRLKDTRENRKVIKSKIIPELERQLVMGIEPEKLAYYANSYLRAKEHLKTYFEYESRVKKILAYFGDPLPTKIKASQIMKYLHTLDLSQKTVRNYRGDIKGMLNIALADGVIDKNPVELIPAIGKISDEEIDPFTKDEIELLLQNADGVLRDYLVVAFYTGLRSGEILGLMKRDVTTDTLNVERGISKGVISTPKTKAV